MNEKRETCGAPRAIDDAQIRATAAQIEISLEAISYYATDLKSKLEVLHKELEFADPVKDRMFEKFLYKLVRFTLPFQSLGELKELAKAIQEFGLPNAAEVREIIRQQKSVTENNREVKILMPKVQKQLTEEMVNA